MAEQTEKKRIYFEKSWIDLEITKSKESIFARETLDYITIFWHHLRRVKIRIIIKKKHYKHYL